MTKAEIMAIEFQSTLPRRERLAISAQFLAMSIFQSTLPRRERPKDFFDQFVHLVFQSTPP